MNERFTPEEKKELQETLARIYKNTPYFQTLPCRVIDFDRGEVRIDFPVEERFCTADGTASAGLMTAFCDTLMGFSSRTCGYRITTLEINMNYVRHARVGELLHGMGTVVNIGEDTLLTEAVIRDDEGRLIVKSRASFYILEKPEKQ